jgi:hypothetical protein
MQTNTRHVAYFGGIRSGKTVAACIRGITVAINCPGSIGVVIRETHVELNDSTKMFFMQWLKRFDDAQPDGQKYILGKNDNENWVKFTNGSVVFFRHATDPGLYKGPTYTWFLVDQAEDLDEEIAKLICDRLSDVRYPNVGMWVGNTDKGHNWCYRWFKLKEKENSAIIETTFLDNIQNLPPEYVKEQLSRPQEEKDIYIYGSWDNPKGLVLRLTKDHFVQDFSPDPGWYLYVACDPPDTTGTFGGLAYYLTYNGDFIFKREYYAPNRRISEHSRELKFLCQHGKQRLVYFDPSAWRKTQAGDAGFLTLVDLYRRNGINPVPAENSIVIGIDLLRELAQVDPEHEHPFTGKKGAPRLYFVKSHLPNLMEEIAGWMIDDPSREPVHLCDPLRYAVASRPVVPVRHIFDREEEYETASFMAM